MRAEVSSAHAVCVLLTWVEVAHTNYDVTKRSDEAIYSVLQAGKGIGSPPLHPLLFFFLLCNTESHLNVRNLEKVSPFTLVSPVGPEKSE